MLNKCISMISNRRGRREKRAKGSKRDKPTCTYLMLHCCKANRLNPLHSWWLPFWNMQTTSRLYSAELQEQLTPHHHAAQTVSLLSESLWRRKKKSYQTPNSVFAQVTREANFDSLNWGEARPGSCCVPKKPKHFLFGPELTQNKERNNWMVEWLPRTIIAVN